MYVCIYYVYACPCACLCKNEDRCKSLAPSIYPSIHHRFIHLSTIHLSTIHPSTMHGPAHPFTVPAVLRLLASPTSDKAMLPQATHPGPGLPVCLSPKHTALNIQTPLPCKKHPRLFLQQAKTH